MTTTALLIVDRDPAQRRRADALAAALAERGIAVDIAAAGASRSATTVQTTGGSTWCAEDAGAAPAFVVVDHRRLDQAELATLGARLPVAVFADRAGGAGDGCALVIDPDPASHPERYPHSAVALGPSWALPPGGDPIVARRIAERVAELAVPSAPLRPTVWSDWQRLLAWANDPPTRAASFTPAAIAEAEHRAWFARRLVDPEARLFIGASAGTAVGTVRLQRAGPRALVSIAIAPEARGRGHGGALLRALVAWCAATRFCAALDAEVALDNPASLTLFRRAGWRDAAAIERGGRAALHLVREVA